MNGVPAVLPQPDQETRGYFEAAGRHELSIQRCGDCHTVLHLPRPMCFNCGSENTEWMPASETGAVRSWTVVTHMVHPAYPPPYALALVELDQPEGVLLVTNILDCDPYAIEQGMKVEVVYQDLPEGGALPQFRPARPDA